VNVKYDTAAALCERSHLHLGTEDTRFVSDVLVWKIKYFRCPYGFALVHPKKT
jgi:hypothetical protein